MPEPTHPDPLATLRLGDEDRLTLVGGQYNRIGSVERLYTGMRLEPYYALPTEDDYLPPVIWDVGTQAGILTDPDAQRSGPCPHSGWATTYDNNCATIRLTWILVVSKNGIPLSRTSRRIKGSSVPPRISP